MLQPTISQNTYISYETDNHYVSFRVEFGKGKDSTSYHRTYYDKPYDIENYNDNNIMMYRLLAEEGPLVVKVYDVNVASKSGIDKRKTPRGYMQYDYGISVVLDMNKEPVYDSPTSYVPSNNIERDGNPWMVLNNKVLQVDQNGSAAFQWSVAKALDKGVKPTADQELMGVEERHENSGMIYITFQPVYTETEFEEHKEQQELTRGLCRGLTRGLSHASSTQSYAARVGYGSRAETKSISVKPIPIPNSRFILPIRTRVIGDTFDPNIRCAKDLQSAIRVEELQKKTGVMSDE